MADWFGGSAGGPGLRLSNGAAAVFLDVLAPAACELARTGFERGFALLVCNARIGSGNDGFDLDELPWSGEWEDERAFLLGVIELARTRFGWELLSYEPPFVDVYLAEYERLVRELPAASGAGRAGADVGSGSGGCGVRAVPPPRVVPG